MLVKLQSNDWLTVDCPDVPAAIVDPLMLSIAWGGRHKHRTAPQWLFPRATPRLAAVVVATLTNSIPGSIVATDAIVDDLIREAAVSADVVQNIVGQAATLPDVPHENFKSYPHQKVGHWIMKDAPAHMAGWDMRTGKTKFAIDCVINHGWRRVLIGCPNKVVPVWVDHFQTHAAMPCRVVALGDNVKKGVAEKARIMSFEIDQAEARSDPRPLVFVVNYESMWRPPLGPTYSGKHRISNLGLILRHKWDAIIGDESHRFGKHDSQISKFMERCHHVAAKRLCLSGTPFSHSPLDIFGQYRFLDPTIYGSFWTPFRERYAVLVPINAMGNNGRGATIVKDYKNLEELDAKFKMIATVVRLQDVMELPPIDDITMHVDLGPKETKAYRELWDEFVTDMGEGVVTVTNALTRVIRVQQTTSGFGTPSDIDTGDALVDARGDRIFVDLEMSKRSMLGEILGDLKSDEPVAVYARFRRDIDAIHEIAKTCGRPSCELSGRINEIGHRWEPRPGEVAAVQIQSGKEGLDLSAAAYSVVYSTGCPSVGEFDQLMARQLGPKQKRPVVRYHLLARGTIDEKVYRALKERRDIIDVLMDSARLATDTD